MSEGKTEAGRREVEGRSEEYHLNGHSEGMQNPEFWRADVKISEFEWYLSKKIITLFSELLPYF
jgi:hypothetical protein